MTDGTPKPGWQRAGYRRRTSIICCICSGDILAIMSVAAFITARANKWQVVRRIAHRGGQGLALDKGSRTPQLAWRQQPSLSCPSSPMPNFPPHSPSPPFHLPPPSSSPSPPHIFPSCSLALLASSSLVALLLSSPVCFLSHTLFLLSCFPPVLAAPTCLPLPTLSCFRPHLTYPP